MKRFLACLLCVCMALSLCVIGVSAEGDVAQVGSKAYSTLESAFGAAGTNGTVKLLKNVDMTGENWTPLVIPAGSSLTIDGGGFTISGLTVTTGCETPREGSVQGDGSSCYYCAGFVGSNKGSLTIRNLTFDNASISITTAGVEKSGASSLAAVLGRNNGTVTMENVNVSGGRVTAYTKGGALIGQTNGIVNITKCSVSDFCVNVVTCTDDLQAAGNGAVFGWVSPKATLNLLGIKASGNSYTSQSTSWDSTGTDPDGTIWGDMKGKKYIIWSPLWNVNYAGNPSFAAEINGYGYITLADAVTAAQSGDTVKLLADVNTGDKTFIVSGKNITLDLNGCTVTTTADPFLKVDVGATLKITDNSGSANGTLYEKRDYSYLLLNKGTLVLEKGNFKAESIEHYPGESKKLGAFALAMASNSVTTINGGTFTGSLYTNGTSENVNVTINGGTYNDMLYLAARTVNVTINGGTFMKGVETKGSTFNITGGTFYPDSTKDIATDHVPNGDGSSTNGAWAFVVVDNAGYGTVNATISGGTFNGPVAMLDDDSDTTNNNDTLAITGGTFSTDPTAYVAPGYVVSGSGPYTVGVPYIPPTPEKPVTETETTTGTDGSKTDTTTTTTTDKTTGSVTEVKEAVTTAPDGTVTKTETTTVTAKDGAAAEATVATAADGKTTAAVTVKAAPEAASATVPAEVIKAVAEAKADEATLTVTTKDAAIEMDAKAIAALTEKGGEAPVITAQAVDKSALTAQQQALVGDAPVIELNVNGGTIDFGTGTVAVSRPYTLKAGEKAEGMVAWFLNAEGKLEKCECSYQNGVLTFKTSHFSKYVIAYFPFTDVKSGEWYYENVVYAFSNNLFKGVSDTAFAPASAMTRQMIWTVLARMDGKTPANYDEAKEWAVTNGISDGTDAQLQITREQLATILYRYAKYKGYEVSAAMGTAGYPDAKDISDWASEAMTWAVSSGIINGSDGQLLPQDSALRCQVAAMLQRFSEKNK